MRKNCSTHIHITRHAINRFYERFRFPGAENSEQHEKDSHARKIIISMFEEAFYLREETGSIYFRAEDYRANLVLRDQKIVTIIHDEFKCKSKIKLNKAS